MSAQTKGVDVLAVMDDVSNNILIPNGGSYADQLTEARAAVAELIEADAEFDKARDGYNPLYATRDQLDRYKAAEARRSAALARVQGGA